MPLSSDDQLKGKVAIVTGASRGIGKAIALGFAAQGAKVAVAARSENQVRADLPGTIHETVETIQAQNSQGLAVPCDVTDEASVQNMVSRVIEAFGRIDVLVNNAGVAFGRSILETPLKRWDLVLRVNLTGAFLCSQAVLPHMIRQGSGSIINISSLAANDRDKGMVDTGVAYGVAKAGLDRLTWGLASEAGCHGVAVNALKPVKVVDSEGMRLWSSEEERQGWTSPARMVACALFLARQSSGSVSGVVATDDEYFAWHGLQLSPNPQPEGGRPHGS
ncbi:MAG: SDR family NAD(P)-dependent oxidoreductase [Proteobacteria bacterium]|nr:SDR family NAD(P)-dependent oxidoreductase [Pseudomonadota bacterium]MBU4385334.1 SDR family NAD(P)-dependent oxidoreductase [Pseudomonadota bacterium]MBU4604326.1 SDR family NAD(P)-dependent oxidoreductase [Pseudomonadota bacterium]MCG2764536.1 SDR family NAD(P)-dependent oxidoreductase [Desulfarculaceae bacterium]